MDSLFSIKNQDVPGYDIRGLFWGDFDKIREIEKIGIGLKNRTFLCDRTLNSPYSVPVSQSGSKQASNKPENRDFLFIIIESNRENGRALLCRVEFQVSLM
jgi:hypothetical protein